MQAVTKRKKVKAPTNFVKQADAHDDISMTKWTDSETLLNLTTVQETKNDAEFRR